MTGIRVSSFAQFEASSRALTAGQAGLARAQAQLASGRIADDVGALGYQARASADGHSLLARLEAEGKAAGEVAQRLASVDLALGEAEQLGENLRAKLLSALGTGQSAGLQTLIDHAASRTDNALSRSENGTPLLASDPFDGTPESQTTGGRFAHGLSRSAAAGVFENALAGIAALGPFGAALTPAQSTALEALTGQLGDGLATLRLARASNGERQAELALRETQSGLQADALAAQISKREDADLAGLAVDIARRQTALEASYAAFARLSGLSLTNYLR